MIAITCLNNVRIIALINWITHSTIMFTVCLFGLHKMYFYRVFTYILETTCTLYLNFVKMFFQNVALYITVLYIRLYFISYTYYTLPKLLWCIFSMKQCIFFLKKKESQTDIHDFKIINCYNNTIHYWVYDNIYSCKRIWWK